MKISKIIKTAAAVKLLETTGKWTPGKQRGNPVAVVITIPVVFR